MKLRHQPHAERLGQAQMSDKDCFATAGPTSTGTMQFFSAVKTAEKDSVAKVFSDGRLFAKARIIGTETRSGFVAYDHCSDQRRRRTLDWLSVEISSERSVPRSSSSEPSMRFAPVSAQSTRIPAVFLLIVSDTGTRWFLSPHFHLRLHIGRIGSPLGRGHWWNVSLSFVDMFLTASLLLARGGDAFSGKACDAECGQIYRRNGCRFSSVRSSAEIMMDRMGIVRGVRASLGIACLLGLIAMAIQLRIRDAPRNEESRIRVFSPWRDG